MELRELVRKILLDNALKYSGQANPKAALGPVIRELPEYKTKSQEVIAIAQEVANEINALSVDDQEKELAKIGGSGAPEKEERDVFNLEYPHPTLRFEPSPSGALHIGHAFPLGLNHLLAEQNSGELILRIADTNPENITEEAYDLIPEDAKWFTHDNIKEIIIQSDRMELYYEYAEKMLQEGWAYVCTCDGDSFREKINAKEACPCRDIDTATNIERWELMKTEYNPGDAVVRVKTDVEHKNPALRDWPALRINTAEHPKHGNKYRVWPLMNFSVSIDDMEAGMTHVLRAKDHADNAKRQEYMYNYFGKPIPEVYNVGKINFTDLKLSSSDTRLKIEEGEYTGWDDIRLPFLPALRRRGFQAEALLRLSKEMGLSSADKKLSQEEYFTNIEAFNRMIIDEIADRAFFVPEPVEIKIENAPEMEIEKDLHPDHRKGGRKIDLKDVAWVSKQDIEEKCLFRFIDGYNFEYKDDKWIFHSKELEKFQAADKKKIIQYVTEGYVEVKVLMPDNTWVSGYAEPHVNNYEEGALLQFERIGFVRLDNKEKMEFWFTHD